MRQGTDERILRRIYETASEREHRYFKYFMWSLAATVVFAIAITGCGTYWNFEDRDTLPLAESLSCVEFSVPETTMRAEDSITLPHVEDITIQIETEKPPIEYIEFTVTAYCACVKCCGKSDGITYSGAKAVQGVTVGADLSVLPIGTVVDIEGWGERIVQDTGYIYGNHLDLYFDSHQEAKEFGRQKLMVAVVDNGGEVK